MGAGLGGTGARSNRVSSSRRAARFCPFLNQQAFEFRQYPDHLPHGAACGCGGVNGFRQRPEGHAPRFQILQEADQVPQRAAQPVKLPDDERVTFRERLKALRQIRPFDVRPGSFVKICLHLACFKAASYKSGFWSSVETRA